jgi:hypothetical protein
LRGASLEGEAVSVRHFVVKLHHLDFVKSGLGTKKATTWVALAVSAMRTFSSGCMPPSKG